MVFTREGEQRSQPSSSQTSPSSSSSSEASPSHWQLWVSPSSSPCSTSRVDQKQCVVLKALVMSLVVLVALSSLGMASVGGVDGAKFQLERARNILRRWKCPGGGYPAGSQKSKVLCLKCPAGSECLGGFNPPKKCSVGKYQHHQGQQFCFDCPKGFYNPLSGQTGCRPASPGSHVPKVGQTKQTKCFKNTYQAKSGQSNCLPCPSGSASGRGATACSSGPEAICGNRCPRNRNYVCGSDGISYPNKCVLGCALQEAMCNSKCPCASPPLPVVEGGKLAKHRKCACPKIYAPVCAMDSKTYGNQCLAHCVEQIVACRGKCPCRLPFPIPGGKTRRPTRRPTSRPLAGLMLGSKRLDVDAGTKQQQQHEEAVWVSKYFYVRQRLGWRQAQDYCARKGSELAVIHSMKEHRAVADACKDECWIGGDRGSSKDGFGWSDESPIDFENWAPEEPKTGLCMQTSGAPEHKWVGADCERSLPFVCQNNYNFPVKVAVDESAVFDNDFSGKNIFMIWTTVVAVSLIGFAGVLLWHAYYTARKEANVVIEEEPVSEKTPLIAKQSMQT